ncbi:MAG: ABC transporter ATP-binding protein [Candidatus Kariarchaeaceae archaeon]|jgi:putative ABC transport system ATP-binding protein
MFSRLRSKQLPDALDIADDESVVVDKLTKVFKQDEREVYALNGISFRVKRGEFFAIIGRSGSGKTSLLNILGAMEKPSGGLVGLNGKTLARLDNHELTMVRRHDVATIYQHYNLIPVLNAFQNVELPLLLTGMEKRERLLRAKKLLELVGLGDRMDHKPDQLSGGERQRVAIARSLANQPKIILADEPTGNLDKEIESTIIELLEGINRDVGTTLIMVTHDPNLAERADRVLHLRDGDIIELREGKNVKQRLKDLEKLPKKENNFY